MFSRLPSALQTLILNDATQMNIQEKKRNNPGWRLIVAENNGLLRTIYNKLREWHWSWDEIDLPSRITMTKMLIKFTHSALVTTKQWQQMTPHEVGNRFQRADIFHNHVYFGIEGGLSQEVAEREAFLFLDRRLHLTSIVY